jgi:hypothetical protein
MKNFIYSLIGIVCTTLVFTSCSENIITDDDQVIFETQAIDKKDSTTPNSDGGEEVDNDED